MNLVLVVKGFQVRNKMKMVKIYICQDYKVAFQEYSAFHLVQFLQCMLGDFQSLPKMEVIDEKPPKPETSLRLRESQAMLEFFHT